MGKRKPAPKQWEPDEPTEDLSTFHAALAAAEEVADEPPAVDGEKERTTVPPVASGEPVTETPPCPPHHWLVQDSADPEQLLWTCVRCQEQREQPRAAEPDRRTWAERARRNGPQPSFGQG